MDVNEKRVVVLGLGISGMEAAKFLRDKGARVTVRDNAVDNVAVSLRAEELRRRTLALYNLAAEHASQRGVIIADTKFEFGRMPDGRLILIDEVLTPDSSRFWPAGEYAPGRDQASFDKQYVRNYLESLDWDKRPPAPPLPDNVVAGTRQRYVEAYKMLTGRSNFI